MSSEPSIKIMNQDAITVVEFTSSSISDVDSISKSSHLLQEFISHNRPLSLIFDFEQVSFFSSQVLGLLLETRKKLLDWKGQVVLSGINAQLENVFRVTNLNQVFLFFHDRDTALRSVAQR